LRVYPIAELEDYFRGGLWKDDVMRTDISLIYAHAREAGAPYPPALKDVKMPELPKSIQMAARPTFQAGVPGVRPVVATAVVKPPPAAGTAAAPAAAAAAAPGAAAAANAAGTQATELRLIALFVAKWKLDPNRTKLILAKLTPPRRRFVIQSFKNAGGDPTASLEQFIAKCEQTNSWGAATTPVAATAQAGFAPQAAGVKRPLTPTMTVDPNKRPRLMTPGALAPPKAGAPALRPVAAAAGGMRPGLAQGGLTPRAVRPPGIRPAVVTPRY